MGSLRLTRPLVTFDLETTGTEIGRDRIIEIGLVRLEADGRRVEWVQRVDPGVPIPPAATAIHGISDEDVRGQPSLADVAGRVLDLLAGADVAGFNSLGFDLPFLAAELERVGRPFDRAAPRHVDAMRIFHLKEPRTLSAAVRFYCGREHEEAHSALADAQAALDVLEAQLVRYGDLPRDPDGLHAFCSQGRENSVDPDGKLAWNAAGEAVFTFGKNKGKTLQQVRVDDPSYLRFIQREDLEKPFSSELRRLAREASAGRFPQRATPPEAAGPEPMPGGAPPPSRAGGQGQLFS